MILAKYLNQLKEKTNGINLETMFVFRGQSYEEWLNESSASRRVKRTFGDNNNLDIEKFLEYHSLLIDGAVENGLETMRSELEILANIQHFGGATCLTDYTRNFLVALWFSTDIYIKDGKEKNGKIFIINLKSIKNKPQFHKMNIENSKNIKNSIIDILKFKKDCILKDKKTKPFFWYWEPKNLNSRIGSQSSIFLFGLPNANKIETEEILISYKDKRLLREELEKFYNISVETLYPDLPGYASNANNSNIVLNEAFSSCFNLGMKYFDKDNYFNAKKCFSDLLECRSDRKKTQERCKKCNISKKHFTYSKYFRGKCYYYEKNYDDAKIDLQEIETLDTNYAIDALSILGEIYYSELKFNEAYDIYSRLIEKYNEKQYYFTLIELSILNNEKDKWKYHLDNISNINYHDENNNEKNLIMQNGILIYEYFKRMGSLYFNRLDIGPIDNEELYKIEYFDYKLKWDFEDIELWTEKIIDNNIKNKLKILTKHTKKIQNELSEKIFNKEKF
jgi:tetratricopeptide (TPR) repeat protein